VVLLGTKHRGLEDGWYEVLLDAANISFTAVFAVEIAVKMLAFTPTHVLWEVRHRAGSTISRRQHPFLAIRYSQQCTRLRRNGLGA
jgi:hypothetical protein